MNNNQHVLSIPEDVPVGTTLGHVILHDFDSSGKELKLINSRDECLFSFS